MGKLFPYADFDDSPMIQGGLRTLVLQHLPTRVAIRLTLCIFLQGGRLTEGFFDNLKQRGRLSLKGLRGYALSREREVALMKGIWEVWVQALRGARISHESRQIKPNQGWKHSTLNIQCPTSRAQTPHSGRGAANQGESKLM